MQIEAYASVFQMVSTVTGELATGRDGFDLVACEFSAGLHDRERRSSRRWRFSKRSRPSGAGSMPGALGYLDLRGGLDLSVVIRTLVWKDGRRAPARRRRDRLRFIADRRVPRVPRQGEGPARRDRRARRLRMRRAFRPRARSRRDVSPRAIYVDIDDVLAATIERLVDLLDELHDRRVEIEHVRDFDLERPFGLDEEGIRRFMDVVHRDDVIESIAPHSERFEPLLERWTSARRQRSRSSPAAPRSRPTPPAAGSRVPRHPSTTRSTTSTNGAAPTGTSGGLPAIHLRGSSGLRFRVRRRGQSLDRRPPRRRARDPRRPDGPALESRTWPTCRGAILGTGSCAAATGGMIVRSFDPT